MLPDSITSVLLAALNAADEAMQGDSQLAAHAEVAPAARALADLTSLSVRDAGDDRANRLAITVRLSMEKFRSAS